MKFGEHLASLIGSNKIGQDLITITIQTIQTILPLFKQQIGGAQLPVTQADNYKMLLQVLTDIIPTLDNIWFLFISIIPFISFFLFFFLFLALMMKISQASVEQTIP